MSSVFTILRKLALLFGGPYGLLDARSGGALMAFGLWLLQPGWMQACFPHIAMDMCSAAPIPLWGIWFCLTGMGIVLFSACGWGRLLAYSYVSSIVIWITVGWLFCVRPTIPPIIGVMAPIFAVASIVRTLNIPDEARFRERSPSL